MAQSKEKPETEHVRVGSVSVTIWTNKAMNKQGKEVEFKTVTLQRGYKDKDGKWANTGSLRVNDLPKAILAFNKAYEQLVMRSSEEDE